MSNPVQELLLFATEWKRHYDSGDYDWCMAQSPESFVELVCAVDQAITGKKRQEIIRSSDLREAKEALSCDRWIVHLSDGGYSRLVIDLASDTVQVGLDRGLSRKPVIEAWDRLSGK